MENNINNENNIKNNKDVDINSTAENNHESLNTDDEILDAHENENTVVEDVDSCEDTITSDNTIACEDTITSDDTNNNDSLDKENNDSIKGKNGLFKAIAIVLIIGLLGGAVGGGSIYYVIKKQLNELSNRTVIANPQTFSTDSEALSASEAFEKVAPAVAIVSVSGVIDYSGIIPKETSGIGSGFIINEEGYILTNYHVIKGAKEVVVTLSDGTDANAKVVNYDENQDVAMLKISDDNIKVPAVVELGNSDALKPGEQVIAIGSPLSKEFGQTVTAGIVSATNRTVKTSSGVELNLIQTDTAINPGNSGGPLVNTKGEVVGINNMKLASDTIEGIGFSIPINSIKDRIDSLSKPILNLGISVREINSELGKQYNMDEGLYIVQVTEFSPAEKAGLKAGDVILKVDGNEITEPNLDKTIATIRGEKGQEVTLTVLREGSEYLDISIVRDEIKVVSVKGEIIDGNIGYIQISSFDEDVAKDFKNKIVELKSQGMKGMILDLRGNPGGSLSEAVNVASQFIPKGKVVTYTIDKYDKKQEAKSVGGEAEGMPLVILIDGGSASASEVVTGALRDYEAGTIIGTTSFGKGIVQQLIEFKDGNGGLKVTTSKYYTPNGENIHKIGIKPDIEVEIPKDILEKEYDRSIDPQFNKGLEVIKEKIK